MTTNGYIDCACRDCFDIAIGPIGALCAECAEAGCDAYYCDCQRADAYGCSDESDESETIATEKGE